MNRTVPVTVLLMLVFSTVAGTVARIPAAASDGARPSVAQEATTAPAPSSRRGTERTVDPPVPRIPAPSTPSRSPGRPGPADVEDGAAGPGWVGGSAMAAAAAAIAFALGKVTRRSASGRPKAGYAHPASQSPSAPAPAPALSGGLATLVEGLIAAHDLAVDPALRASIEQTLRQVGVVPVAPAVGVPLDVSQHEVVGVRPSSEPSADGIVAVLVRSGWSGHGALLRPAQVLVHKGPR